MIHKYTRIYANENKCTNRHTSINQHIQQLVRHIYKNMQIQIYNIYTQTYTNMQYDTTLYTTTYTDIKTGWKLYWSCRNTRGKLQGNNTETVRHLQENCKNTQLN